MHARAARERFMTRIPELELVSGVGAIVAGEPFDLAGTDEDGPRLASYWKIPAIPVCLC